MTVTTLKLSELCMYLAQHQTHSKHLTNTHFKYKESMAPGGQITEQEVRELRSGRSETRMQAS